MAEVTVTEHLLQHQNQVPMARGRFTHLFNDLILSAKIISRSVNKAGLVDILGGTGETNIQGESVQKLDEFANRILIYRMKCSGAICAMVSEENADVIVVPKHLPQDNYLLVIDPLDGSTNIDVNINVGTIFSILRRNSSVNEPNSGDFLRPGYEQVAAGYFLYGPSTMLVYSTGNGVHGFTLDPSVGEFLLSHNNMRIPERGNIYSVNESNGYYWDEKTRAAVAYFKGTENAIGRPYSLRYVGSLVADFHRTLLYGGIFMYPLDYKNEKNPRGKLRYLCEASPMAFLAEQAGGLATNGHARILDLVPKHIHERTPLFIGSKTDVEAVQRIYQQYNLD